MVTTEYINKDSIVSQAHKNIFSIINDRSNVLDPKRKDGSSGRTFVYLVDPFVKDPNFSDEPYIVLEPPRPSFNNYSTDGKFAWTTWTQMIIVRADYEGSGKQEEGIGLTDIWDISDDILSTFNSDSVRQTLRELGLFSVRISSDTVDTTMMEQTFTLTYKTRMRISA